MEFLVSHWHCILPLIGLAVYFLCAARDASKSEDED
jgi:hypothetical protein